MVDFTAKTYASAAVTLFDLKMSATGKYLIPAPNNGSWTPLKRDAATGNYVLAANTGFGTAQSGGSAIPDDELTCYATHLSSIYRGKRSGPGSDDFAYAPDNWNLAMGGNCRALDVSPDGAYIAAGVAGTVKVWNTTTKALVLSFATTGALVESLKFSPDGQYLVAGERTKGLFLWHISGATFTRITSGSMLSGGYGNWNIAWHADSAMFLATYYLAGSFNGVYCYVLTDAGTHAFTRQANTVFDPQLTVTAFGITFLNMTDAKDYALICNYSGSSTPKLYFWGGASFSEVATTGLGTGRTYEGFAGSVSGHSIAWFDTTTSPYAGAWEFPTFADPVLTIDIEADLPFADFEASALAGALATVEADLPFADFEATALVGIDGALDGDLPFADFTGALAIAEGVLPGSPVRISAAEVYSGGIGAVSSSVVATGFAYVYRQDLPFADFEASALVGIDGTINDDLPFADFEALATQYPEITIEADLPFADFSAEAVIERRTLTVEADLPFADFDAAVQVGIGVYVESNLPFADFDAVVFQNIVATVEADLPFADFSASAGTPVSGSIEADLPFADFDATADVFKIDAWVEADLPFADFDATLDAPLGVRVAGDLPFADFTASVNVPLGINIAADLPFADFAGYATVPLRIDINAALPFADFEATARLVTFMTIEADLPFADFFAYTSGALNVRGYHLAPNIGVAGSVSLGGGAYFGNNTIKAG